MWVSAHPVHKGFVLDEVRDYHVVHIQDVVDAALHVPHEGSHEDRHVFERLGSRFDVQKSVLIVRNRTMAGNAHAFPADEGSRRTM